MKAEIVKIGHNKGHELDGPGILSFLKQVPQRTTTPRKFYYQQKSIKQFIRI